MPLRVQLRAEAAVNLRLLGGVGLGQIEKHKLRPVAGILFRAILRLGSAVAAAVGVRHAHGQTFAVGMNA